MQALNAFIRNVKDIGREAWLQKLNAARIVLKDVLQPVQDVDCIGCLVRQGYHASSGVTLARVVLKTHSG